jgi:hypothetical protein
LATVDLDCTGGKNREIGRGVKWKRGLRAIAGCDEQCRQAGGAWYNNQSRRLRGTMYIDPTSGGVLFQALAAVFVAVSGIVLVFSGRIRGFFAQLRRKTREGKEDRTEAKK